MFSVKKQLGSCKLNHLFLSSQQNDTCFLSIEPFYHKVTSFIPFHDLPYLFSCWFKETIPPVCNFCFVYLYQAQKSKQSSIYASNLLKQRSSQFETQETSFYADAIQKLPRKSKYVRKFVVIYSYYRAAIKIYFLYFF